MKKSIATNCFNEIRKYFKKKIVVTFNNLKSLFGKKLRMLQTNCWKKVLNTQPQPLDKVDFHLLICQLLAPNFKIFPLYFFPTGEGFRPFG